MFNETNLLFFFLIVALLVVSMSWMFLGDMPLFKRRYLPIVVLFLLLFMIGAIVILKPVVDVRNSESELIEVCRKDLASAGYMSPAGYTVWECQKGNKIYTPVQYQRMDFVPFSTAVRVHFTDGTNLMWCTMERRGSEWVVTGVASTIASMCPN